MRTFLIAMVLALTLLAPATKADDSLFTIRADGLACPYCAYGIEKKLMKINGVKHVDIKLSEGLVLVKGTENLTFTQGQLMTLFKDAGFSFRSVTKTQVPDDK